MQFYAIHESLPDRSRSNTFDYNFWKELSKKMEKETEKKAGYGEHYLQPDSIQSQINNEIEKQL